MKHLLFFILVLCYSPLKSCSCELTTFCEVMNDYPNSVVIKGAALENISHVDGYTSKIIEVLHVFKDNNNLRDTIEIIGGPNGGLCEDYVQASLGDTLYIAIPIINSTSNYVDIPIVNENYTRHFYGLCSSFDVVIDQSDKTISDPYLTSHNAPHDIYTEEEFDDLLTNGCMTSSIQEDSEPIPSRYLKSNLSRFGQIQFKEEVDLTSIDQVNLYTMDGQRIYSGPLKDHLLFIDNLHSNLIIVETIINGQAFIEKLIVVE